MQKVITQKNSACPSFRGYVPKLGVNLKMLEAKVHDTKTQCCHCCRGCNRPGIFPISSATLFNSFSNPLKKVRKGK